MNELVTKDISFVFDEQKRALTITVQSGPIELSSSESQQLLELLYSHHNMLFRAVAGIEEPTLPEWVMVADTSERTAAETDDSWTDMLGNRGY